jgi:hypothetical protein
MLTAFSSPPKYFYIYVKQAMLILLGTEQTRFEENISVVNTVMRFQVVKQDIPSEGNN